MKQSGKKEQGCIRTILERLAEEYPEARCALEHRNPFQLLVATILSAQCTDVRVNQVTPELFRRYPDPKAMSLADREELEELIRSTGFFRNKAKNLQGMARCLMEEFDGRIPRTIEDLIRLPGVARKTANVVLGTWYGIPAGIVVDTHVRRLANRMGLANGENPEQIEKELMEKIPRDAWIDFSHRMILHGRSTCRARKPLCRECCLLDACPTGAESLLSLD